jgi:hypothetical protein
MALITFKPTVAAWPPPPPPPSGTYKRRRPPAGSPRTQPLYFALPSRSNTTTTSLPSLDCHTTSRALVRPETSSLRSPLFCALAGELTCSGVAGGQTSKSTPPCPSVLPSTPPSVHGGPHDPVVVHRPWTDPRDFLN